MKKLYFFFLNLLLLLPLASQVTNWNIRSGSLNCTSTNYNQVKTDAAGNVYRFHCNYDSISIYSNSSSFTFPAPSGYSTIFVKSDSSGNIITSGSIDGPKNEFVHSFDVAPNGNLLMLISGDSSVIDIDPGPGVNSVTNPMQVGNNGWILVLYDNNLNLLGSWTDFNINPNNVHLTNTGFYLEFLNSGPVDIDLSSGINSIPKANGYLTNEVVSSYDYSGNLLANFKIDLTDSVGMFQQPPLNIIHNLTTDMAGNIYISGFFTGLGTANTTSGTVTAGITNHVSTPFYLKANASGQILSFNSWNSLTTALSIVPGCMDIDSNGEMYFILWSDTTGFDIDPGTGITNFTGPENSTLFIKLDPNGNLITYSWSENFWYSFSYYSTIDVENGKVACCLTNANWLSNVCYINYPNGSSDITLCPNLYNIPVICIFDSSFHLISYLNSDSSLASSVSVDNVDIEFYKNGILFSGSVVGNGDIDISPTNSILMGPNGGFFSAYYTGGFIPGGNEINGHTYYDIDNSGNYNSSTDMHAVFHTVNDGTGNYYSFTDTVGNYKIYAGLGNYSVSTQTLYSNFPPAPANYNFNFSNTGNVSNGNDFAFTAAGVINDVSVQQFPFANVVPGFSRPFWLTMKNEGTIPATFDVVVVMDSLHSYDSASVLPTYIGGDSIVWSAITLMPLQYSFIEYYLKLDSTAVIGDTIPNYVYAVNAGDANPVDNADTSLYVVSNAFDPNYKTVDRGSLVTMNEMNNNSWFDYVIHFQNTGTDTAMNVHIVDTISDLFDLTTLQVLGASHNVSPVFVGNRIIDFKFNNIWLPDSNINEPASHGYVHYRIQANNGYLPGTQFTNTANIFFDFNVPVITNTALTEIYSITTGNNNLSLPETVLWPNPATNKIFISSNNLDNEGQVEISDIEGRIISHSNYSKENPVLQIDISMLKNGIYFARLIAKDGKTIVKKFSVTR